MHKCEVVEVLERLDVRGAQIVLGLNLLLKANVEKRSWSVGSEPAPEIQNTRLQGSTPTDNLKGDFALAF
jgi:hypothetical protein